MTWGERSIMNVWEIKPNVLKIKKKKIRRFKREQRIPEVQTVSSY